MTGAEIVIRCLHEQGVDTVFGYPGATNLALYDALCRDHGIRHILTAHEQGACHAADGYARVSGKPGVCMATSGPGATNLVTGIATAMMDSVPLVAITCNVAVDSIGKDSFQEVDIFGITLPITKHNFLVKDVHDLPGALTRAFRIAGSGRRGPVLVDIAKDVTHAELNEEEYAEALKKGFGHYEKKKSAQQESGDAAKLWQILAEAERPVILTGGGAVASEAEEQITALAEYIDAPVCETLMGKSAYPGSGCRYLGMVGQHGTKAANTALRESDCILALGVRFSERITGGASEWCTQAKICQIDLDAAEVNKNVRVDAWVLGDVKECLKDFASYVPKKSHKEWMERMCELREQDRAEGLRQFEPGSGNGLCGTYLAMLIDRITAGNAILSTDVGQHQMWMARNYLVTKPHRFLTSGGLGTMGYGLPAAIGASLACPGEKVINVTGDGCFRMNMNELTTVARYRLPIIDVVFDNHALGLVHQWQHMFCDDRFYETELPGGPDYVRIAEAMGIPGYRVRTKAEAEKVFKSVFAQGGPAVIVCELSTEDSLWTSGAIVGME
ncbi:MAG: biosynthetic-type acetolactate synthase large subunit [Lachnospiraceae bacterium]|nr:biosynthetic-type acetolactate synthase large subunit [Lachnospiraceae bacterium]